VSREYRLPAKRLFEQELVWTPPQPSVFVFLLPFCDECAIFVPSIGVCDLLEIRPQPLRAWAQGKKPQALFISELLVELILEELIFSKETIKFFFADEEEVEAQVAVDSSCF
jgi:hypothetical protein